MRSKLAACVVLFFGAACGRAPLTAAGGLASSPSPSASETPAATVAPTPSESPAGSSGEGRLLLATKSGNTVTVSVVDLKTSATATLFTYEERAEAEHSGNFWDEQPPSIALSRERRLLAYGAVDGLHVYDVETGKVDTLVRRVAEEKPDSDAPSKWSPAIDTYAFVGIRWSGDGRYLSFNEPHYEGNDIGFFDRTAHRPFHDEAMPTSYVPALDGPGWAASGSTAAVTLDGERAGLFISKAGDPEHSSFVRVPHVNISRPAVSPDASRIAFLFGSSDDFPSDVPMDGLSVVRRDGTGRRIVDEAGTKSSVAFDSEGDLLWMEGGTMYRWDGSAKTTAARVDDAYRWEITAADATAIGLTGRSEKAGRGLFLLLQRSTGKAIAVHGVSTDYVTFLGVI